MSKLSVLDRAVLFGVNVFVYLRHPLFTGYFRHRQGHWPDFACPSSLSELVQWRKLFDRNPSLPMLADKLAVRSWLARQDPTLSAAEQVWAGHHVEDLPDQFLAPGFVIKANHGSGLNYFPHRDGTDRDALTRTVRRWTAWSLRAWLRRFLVPAREWIYGPIPRRIFAERMIEADPVLDVAVRTFDGLPVIGSITIDQNRPGSRSGFFWADGRRFLDPDETPDHALPADFELPPSFRRAVEHARILSRGIDYARFDFLADRERVYFGEITFYPASGYGRDNWRTAAVYRFWLEALELSWPLAAPQRGPMRLYMRSFGRWLALHRASLGPASEFAQQHGWRPLPESPAR